MPGTRCRDGRCQRMTPGLCPPCADRLHDWLSDLPELWVRLTLATPSGGGNGGEPVTGSREAPVPVRVDVLDHIAATKAVLAAWATAIMADRHVGPPTEHPPFAFHRVHRTWTAGQSWADDYAAAVHWLWSRARTVLGYEARSYAVGQCIAELDDGRRCGDLLTIQPDHTVIQCRSCGTVWPQERWLILGAAIRELAAAGTKIT